MSAVYYAPSKSRTYQGSLEDVRTKFGDEYIIKPLGGGCGNWLLLKRSDVFINGKSYRDFVLRHYEKRRLTESLVEKFRQDLASGKIVL